MHAGGGVTVPPPFMIFLSWCRDVQRGCRVSPRCHLREWRPGWLPRPVRVWVSRTHFIVLWASQNGFGYSWSRYPFFTSGPDQQMTEVMLRVWEGPVKRKDVAKLPGAKFHADPGELKKSH